MWCLVLPAWLLSSATCLTHPVLMMPDHLIGRALQLLRKSFLALFTRKALSMYVQQQDGIIRQHLAAWLEVQAAGGGAAMEVRNLVRDMNANTSQRVFIGEGQQCWVLVA